MPKLVITEESGTREVGLTAGDTLGRVPGNAVHVQVPEASRRHCRFTEEKGTWFIEDLGSSNGTLVNGRRVTKFELQDGDEIQIGEVTLRYLDTTVDADEPEVEWGDDEISLDEETFLILGGAGRVGELVKLTSERLTVGRNAKHSLQIKDKSVSGDHAELVREGDVWSVRDLGSSNGTFVDDRTVEQAELQSGDVVRFGGVPCTFGVGDPKEFSAPAAAASGGESQAFTRVVTAADLDEEDDPSFELHDRVPRKEGIWNVLALLTVAGLGAGVFFLMTHEPSTRQRDASRSGRGSNLLPELAWSFELPEGEVPEGTGAPSLEWDKDDPGDGVDMEICPDPVRSGSFACRMDRGDPKGPPSLAVFQQPLNVSSGAAYKLAAAINEASATPVLGVIWLASRTTEDGIEQVRETQDFVFGAPSRDDWEDMGGIVVAPEGAEAALVAVGIAGSGSVVFDDVSFVAVDMPPGRIVSSSGFRASLGAQGTVRLSRYGRRIVDGLGIEVAGGDEVLRQDQLLIAAPAEGSITGSLRGNRGDIRVTASAGEKSLAVELTGAGLAAAKSLVLPLVPREEHPVQVTVIDGERGARHARPYDTLPGTALILGSSGDRVRLTFNDAAGKPQRLASSFVQPKGELPFVRVALPGADVLRLDFQLSFATEAQAARALVGKAKDAARRKRNGEAIALSAEIMARYPFEEALEREASELHNKLLTEGRDRLAALARALDDAVFFRDLEQRDDLRTEIQAEVDRYGGTSVAPGLEELLTRFDKERAQWDRPRRLAAAGRSLMRAKDYLDGGKKRLALLFFETILKEHPDTDESDQAETYVRRLKQEGK